MGGEKVISGPGKGPVRIHKIDGSVGGQINIITRRVLGIPARLVY